MSQDWPPWSDDSWRESGDNPWRRGLRLQQAWWRSTHTALPAGHIKGRARPVASMLPEGTGWQPNLMTQDACDAAKHAIARMKNENRPGIIAEDRLRRNLLSSQPLCFNLFGHLGAHPDALLPWVRSIAPDASSVECIELEFAPMESTIGGSAFDAFIEYRRTDGAAGFLGVECKYAEDLKASQRTAAAKKYISATTTPPWKQGAAASLDKNGLRQLWYNQLLTQIVAASDDYAEDFGVVVACAADRAAKGAVAAVQSTLLHDDELRFCSIEEILASIQGHESWRAAFATRYIDFTPIQALLDQGDPRTK